MSCHLENLKGKICPVIAGESAAFRFSMSGSVYAQFVD